MGKDWAFEPLLVMGTRMAKYRLANKRNSAMQKQVLPIGSFVKYLISLCREEFSYSS